MMQSAGQTTEKREHTTYLSAGNIVGKSDPRIEFRGLLDSLCAEVVERQVRLLKGPGAEASEDLEEVRTKLCDLLTCEATGKPCDELTLWGLSGDELRERSHYPAKYFGIGHIRAHYSMGKTAAELNVLRTKAREAELAACRAFETPEGVERPDIIKFLNRLSSAIYVLTYKYLPKGYDKTIRF
ncbi:MAG: hypothetical protein LBT65_01520 [Synergistaceae bacterium]|nr:hypothetical protein [Synergistaceae bacterium]